MSSDPSTIFPNEEALVAKCLELGLVMCRAPHYDVTHPAITLTPHPISKAVLEELQQRQLLWNEAVDRTARNFEFLSAVLKETAASDSAFTGRLVKMLEDVYLHAPSGASNPIYQSLMLGIFRSDYMRAMPDTANEQASDAGRVAVAETAEQWKNVEINTVSCSFAGLSPLVGEFHLFLQKYRNAVADGASAVSGRCRIQRAGEECAGLISVSSSGADFPAAIATAAAAWRARVPLAEFISHHAATTGITLRPIVLVVIQEGERNTGDQYKLIFKMLETHGLVSLRRTHTQLHGRMTLLALPGTEHTAPPFAIVEDTYVASVVYFRSTYVPEDFPTEDTWAVREQLERCNAVKCPSIPFHLLTLKKLQQVMTNVDGMLTPIAFGGDAAKATALAAHFMAQYSLNAAEYPDTEVNGQGGPECWINKAIAEPDKYVLKPQLEGGGNLIAGETMQTLLRDTPSTDPLYHRIRKEYILMRKIAFPKSPGLLLRQGTTHAIPNVCSELGIFGTILSDGTAASYAAAGATEEGSVFNQCAGQVVRTKPADMEDGGVMAGVACLDSVLALEPCE